MQFFKDKKVIIACIVLSVIILGIIIAVCLHKKKPEEENQKKYLDGEMTLVDTLGKGSGHAAEVYITKDQNLLLNIENSLDDKLYVKETEDPIYEVSVDKVLETRSTQVIVRINAAPVDPTEKTDVLYPCDCEVVVASDIFGFEYTVNLSVDTEVIYKNGKMETKPIDYTQIEGYNEFVKKYGNIALPEQAIIVEVNERVEALVGYEPIEVGVCTYYLDGGMRNLEIADASDYEDIRAFFGESGSVKITVNGVEALVFSDRGACFACYSYGGKAYINKGFCEDTENTNESTLIAALTPYIVK